MLVNQHPQFPLSDMTSSSKGQKIQRVGRTTKHALPQPVFGLGLIGGAVGFLLAADKCIRSYRPTLNCSAHPEWKPEHKSIPARRIFLDPHVATVDFCDGPD